MAVVPAPPPGCPGSNHPAWSCGIPSAHPPAATDRQGPACSSASPLPTARVGREQQPRHPAPPPAPPVPGRRSPARSRPVGARREPARTHREAGDGARGGGSGAAWSDSGSRWPESSAAREGRSLRAPAAFARAASANERARAAFESQRPRAGRLRAGRRGGARLGQASLGGPGSRLGAGGPGAGMAPGPGGGASGPGRPRLLEAARPDCLLLATTPARAGPDHAEPSFVTSRVPGSRRPVKSPPGGHGLRPPRRGLGARVPLPPPQLTRARSADWCLLPALSPQAVPGRPPSPARGTWERRSRLPARSPVPAPSSQVHFEVALTPELGARVARTPES